MVEQPTLQAIRATGRNLSEALERLADIVSELERRNHDGRHSLTEARALVHFDRLRADLERKVLGPLANLVSGVA